VVGTFTLLLLTSEQQSFAFHSAATDSITNPQFHRIPIKDRSRRIVVRAHPSPLARRPHLVASMRAGAADTAATVARRPMIAAGQWRPFIAMQRRATAPGTQHRVPAEANIKPLPIFRTTDRAPLASVPGHIRGSPFYICRVRRWY